MDKLPFIKPLIISNQSDQLKKAICEKILKKAVEEAENLDTAKKLVALLTEWILTTDVEYLKTEALSKFDSLLEKNLLVVKDVCDMKFVSETFVNPLYSKGVTLVGFVMTLLRHINKKEENGWIENLRGCLVVYVCDHGGSLASCTAACHLFRSYPVARPSKESDISRLCHSLVKHLSSYSVPTQAQLIGNFRRDTEAISSLLPLFWAENHQLCLQNLNTVYSLLASEDANPSMCLLTVIEKVPLFILSPGGSLVETLVSSSSVSLVVTRLCVWLSLWPCSHTPSFLLALLRQLRDSSGRASILHKVAETATPNIVSKLTLPVFRSQLEGLFFFLLYGSQSSLTVFLSLVRPLADLLKKLKTDSSASELYLKLVEAVGYFMYLFPKSKAIYSPLEPFFEDGQEITEERQAYLSSLSFAQNPSEAPSFQGIEELTSRERRVGLINLGNTCYINSVVQALFYIPNFRAQVLASSPCESQPLLDSLQQVFIFLSYSLRSIFSPSTLVRLARPSWFLAGEQQDCSELLTHLLDSLKEEEKQAREGQEPVKKPVVKSVGGLTPLADEPDADSNTQRMDEDSGTEEPSCEGRTKGMGKCGMSASRDSGIQSLGLPTASTHPATLTEPPTPEVEPPAPNNLVSSTFGGTLLTCITCLSCGHTSRTTSEFTNLHLALPEENPKETDQEQERGPFQSSALVPISKEAKDVGVNRSNDDSGHDDSFHSLDHTIVDEAENIAKMENRRETPPTYFSPDIGTASESKTIFDRVDEFQLENCDDRSECVNAGFNDGGRVSLQSSPERFENSSSNKVLGKPPPLDIQKERLRAALSTAGAAASAPSVPSLLSASLSPERLAGDNSYFCSPCHSLRDAVKTQVVTSPPSHLLLTILRFKYDRALGQRVKLLTWVDTPQELRLGLSPRNSRPTVSVQAGGPDHAPGSQPHGLESGDFASTSSPSVSCSDSDELTACYRLSCVVVHSGRHAEGGHYYTWARDKQGGDSWLRADDSRVTQESWQAFRRQTVSSSADTPYLLVYSLVPPAGSVPHPLPSPNLGARMESLLRDNDSYLRSKHTSSSSTYGVNTKSNNFWDEEPPEGGVGGACQDNFGQFGGGRFVC